MYAKRNLPPHVAAEENLMLVDGKYEIKKETKWNYQIQGLMGKTGIHHHIGFWKNISVQSIIIRALGNLLKELGNFLNIFLTRPFKKNVTKNCRYKANPRCENFAN